MSIEVQVQEKMWVSPLNSELYMEGASPHQFLSAAVDARVPFLE